MKTIFIFFLASAAFTFATLPLTKKSHAKEVRYELTVDYKTVNYSGRSAQAMAINNSIPGPVLEFQEGDTAIINVINKTGADASIHWHGLLLPQEQDGVPYMTFFPIEPGASFEYQFDLTHAGTYWYHSHSRIDEQRGQYGAIVVHPKAGYEDGFDHDVVVQLSDWTDEDPHKVLKNLKKDGDWYAHKKNAVTSIHGYIKNSSIRAWLSNRWQRMEGMDASDVGYDAFLANGKTALTLVPEAKVGERVRVRLINSGASSYFDIQQNSGSFEVIAADGLDVTPIKVNTFRMGMAETYDVIVTIPESGAYEFAANNIDGTGGVNVTLGSGYATPAPSPERPNLFEKMTHGENHSNHHETPSEETSHHKHHQHHHHNHHNHGAMANMQEATELNYRLLKSRKAVTYKGEFQEYTLRLTGDMESYNWSFNNTPLSKSDTIKIDRGKVVHFHFQNETMMHHPLHLHGHFFKVITGNNEHDVLKHTVDVPPMGNVTIEFLANEEKDWFFHCHNLYHAKTGMARVIRYSDYSGNRDFEKAKMRSNEIMDTDWYGRGDLHLLSSHAELMYRYSNARNIVELEAARHFSEESEFSLQYSFKKSRWLDFFASVEREDDENELLLGLAYTTPFLFETELYTNQDGNVDVEIETEFQLTQHIGLEVGASTDSEWTVTWEYRTSPSWAIEINANDISGVGAGITATF